MSNNYYYPEQQQQFAAPPQQQPAPSYQYSSVKAPPPMMQQPQQPVQTQPQQPYPAIYHQQISPAVEVHAQQPLIASSAKPCGAEWIEPTQNDYDPIIPLIFSLLLPGLGHLVIGQTYKGIYFLASNIILSSLASFLGVFLIGLLLIPLILFEYIVCIVDSFYMAKKLKAKIPIMQGEFAYSWMVYGANLFITPSFAASDASAPLEYKARMAQLQTQA